MNLRKFVRDYLTEQQALSKKLDLSNRDNIVSWLNDNAPESIFDDNGEIDWEYTDPMTGDDLDTMIYSYMEKYNDVASEYEIEVYRMIKLNSIKDLDLKRVGLYWSFDKNGVGAYGGVGNKFEGNHPFTLNATIKTEDIEWEQGFYSFLSYGKSEFECYVKKGSKCLITHINDKKLNKPIQGIC